ncbi:MAG: hypothetical protein ACF8MF_12065 [Phycisphaerales bacterium JB052]
MTDTQTPPAPLNNAVCMHCGYDITGTIPDSDKQVTCPECGLLLRPSSRLAMTRRDVHLSLIRSIALPYFIWSAITILGLAPDPLHESLFAFFLIAIFALGYPIALLISSISAWSKLHHQTKVYPRPYHRGLIPLWILTYLIPVASLYPLVFIVMRDLL